MIRRVAAEAVGTGVLVAVVLGSGMQAEALTQDVGLRLLANCLATVFGLGVLITLLGPVSGAHFNPVVTLATRGPVAYLAGQVAGAVGGAILANAMFGRAPVSWSTHDRTEWHLMLGEVVATAGLVVLVLGLARLGRPAAWTIAAYIGAAYWFTSSTSFANPAVTIGRAFSDSFAGIAPASVPWFVGAQAVGALIGFGLVPVLFGPRHSLGAA